MTDRNTVTTALATLGANGWEIPATSPGIEESQRPVIVLGGDHPYLQWYGTNGYDGMAAMYLDRGLRPYMAINTRDPGGEFPGAPGRLSWTQIAELAARGVEITNHGARHFQSWLRCTSGITVRYNGAGTDAFLTINSSKLLTTTCTGAAGDNQSFDLTNASYNTLQKVVNAFNAVAGGKYQAALAAELVGDEDSINLAQVTGLGIHGGAADTGFSVATRANSTAYVVGNVVKASPDNGYFFVCTTAGTSGAGLPTWNTEVGATTTDGTATWTCRYPQAQYLGSTVSIVPFKGWNVSASGGLIVQHIQSSGAARNTAMITIASNLLTLSEDGVQVAQFNLTSANYNTLTKIAAAIGAVTNWFAKVCDQTYYDAGTYGASNAGPAYNNYCGGGELSRDLKNVAALDCSSSWVRLETGLSQWYVIERNVQKAHDDMVANGVTPKAFCQSGGEFYPWLAAGHTQYDSWRGDPFSRSSINPMQERLSVLKTYSGWFPHRDFNDTVPLSSATMQSYVDALIDSGPWLSYTLCHWLQVDGSSGYNLNPQPPGAGFGSSEAIYKAFLDYLRTKIEAGRLLNATPSELPRIVAGAAEPRSLIFNPKLVNNGDALGSLSSDGKKIAGWLVRTGTTPTISVANGVMSITAIGSQQLPLAQDFSPEPGVTYEAGLYVEFDATHAGNGIRLGLQTRRGGSSSGPRFRDMDPGGLNVLASQYQNRSGLLRFRFTWPKRADYARAYIRGVNTEPFDLSVNKNIQVNYDNIGATADIDCSVGAVSVSAVTAKEVAARINTVVAATAAYLTRAEFHNIARAENGRVIIELPYRGNPGSTFWVRALAGSVNSALATIFGIGSGLTCQGEPQMAPYQDVEDASAWLYVDVNTTAGSIVKLRAPWVYRAVYA